MHSMASVSTLNVTVLVLFLTAIANAQPLSRNYYRTRCPNLNLFSLKLLVGDTVGMNPRMGASLLRLHFQDCFVNGCDASILLDDQGRERSSVHNAGSLRGFDVIDMMKEIVEEKCPGVVSCADLLAYAAEVSVIAIGGPSWPVLFGRKDSKTSASAANATAQLPSANAKFKNLITLLARKGFSLREMVALSGQSRCKQFRNRIYNEPNINITSAKALRKICPKKPGIGDNNLAPLDFLTPNEFNNDYFIDLLNRQGVLHSDQALFSGTGTQSDDVVRLYANNKQQFFTDFSNAMFKMSKIGALTGRNGMIRTNCRSAR